MIILEEDLVDKRRQTPLVLGLFILLTAGLWLFGQTKPNLKDILEKNVQAAGGKDKIGLVKTYSFKTGPTAYCVSSEGRTKITSGKDPVITEIILISPERVQRNYYDSVEEITGPEKGVYQCLSKLFGGFFTLSKFADELKFQGLQSYGPEKLFLLTAEREDLKISFYLHPEEYTLKRIVLQGFWGPGMKNVINFDFGPYQEVEGLRLPSSWFRSYVGLRGTVSELSEVRLNPTLEPGFFTGLDVNIGQVQTQPDFLKGNVLDFVSGPDNLVITTNWSKKAIDNSGLKTNDTLIFSVGGIDSEITFLNEPPSPNALPGGGQFMTLSFQGGATAVVIFYKTDFSRIKEKLMLLGAIQVRKK